MTHTLYVLRHAKSDWPPDVPDHDRPLTERGRRQAAEAGRWLDTHASIDVAAVSSAERAQQTWSLVRDQLRARPADGTDERIYAASVDRLLDVVHGLPDDVGNAVLIGHNPGLEHLVGLLTSQQVTLPTSAIAVIGVEGSWSDARTRASLQAAGRPPS